MHDLTVTAIGKDRPGIVAAATRAFYELGCNLADCSMTRLSDQFAMILLVQAPDEVTKDRLYEALEGPAQTFGLDFQVAEGPHQPTSSPKRPFVISLYGADHPGIVFRITAHLAEKAVNITDLVSRVVGDNVFLMVIDIDLPESLDESLLGRELEDLARDLDVDVTLRPAETADL